MYNFGLWWENRLGRGGATLAVSVILVVLVLLMTVFIGYRQEDGRGVFVAGVRVSFVLLFVGVANCIYQHLLVSQEEIREWEARWDDIEDLG